MLRVAANDAADVRESILEKTKRHSEAMEMLIAVQRGTNPTMFDAIKCMESAAANLLDDDEESEPEATVAGGERKPAPARSSTDVHKPAAAGSSTDVGNPAPAGSSTDMACPNCSKICRGAKGLAGYAPAQLQGADRRGADARHSGTNRQQPGFG